jgi:hypothetical protein
MLNQIKLPDQNIAESEIGRTIAEYQALQGLTESELMY